MRQRNRTCSNLNALWCSRTLGCFKTSREANCCVSYGSLSHDMNVFWVSCLFIISNPLYHLMEHGEEPHLDWSIGEVWKEWSNKHKQSEEPVWWCWCTCFNEDLIGSGWYSGIHCSIHYEEYVPENNATPYEQMLNVSEITDG